MKYALLILTMLPPLLYGQLANIPFELIELGDSINSRYHETAPLVSPDGNTLYFFRANSRSTGSLASGNSQDIWFSKRDENGFWGEAQRMESPLNKENFNQVFTILDNGNTLLVRGGHGRKQNGFSITQKTGNSWSHPSELDIEGYQNLNRGRFSGASMSQDKEFLILYFSEHEHNQFSDLYLSRRISEYKYSAPTKIEALSTPKDEFGPYLAADDKYLYFASNRQGSLGSMDVFVTERLDDTWTNWGEIQNVGPPINTGGFDAYFSVDASGKYAFTTRTYVSPDGSNLDVYGLVPKPKIVISGTVYNADTKEPLSLEFNSYLTDQDPLTINADEKGLYSFTVYDRGSYRFIGLKEGFEDLDDTLDISLVRLDTTIQKDLYITPRKVEINLFGYATDSKSVLPVEVPISIIHRGKSKEVVSGFEDGYYKAQLFGEGEYKIEVKNEFYEPFSLTFQVEPRENEYFLEIQKDIVLNPKQQPYSLSGFVQDAKTLEPLAVTLEFEVDGQVLGTAKSSLEDDGYYQTDVTQSGMIHIRAVKEGYINLDDSVEIYDNPDFLTYEKDLLLTPIEVGVTVVIENIYFDFDKTRLKPESFTELNRLVALLEANPSITIEIAGHTDDKGSDEYNEELSQGRADAVMNYVIENGISQERIVAKGYGETKPVATNYTDEGRAQNRRVEFTILSK